MSSYTSLRTVAAATPTPIIMATGMICAGLMGAYRWPSTLFGFDILTPDIVFLHPSTGIAVTFIGCALFLSSIAPACSDKARLVFIWSARILAVALFGMGTLGLVETWFGVSLQFDPSSLAISLLPHSTQTDSMFPLASLCLILCGANLAWLDVPSRSGHYYAEYGALAIVALTGISLLGFLYSGLGVAEFASLSGITPVTPIFFLIAALGILSSRPQHPLMNLWRSDAPGGHLLRRLLPASLLLIVALNVLIEWGQRQGWYGQDKISPMVVFFSSTVLFVLFFRAASMLNREYGVRRQGEEALSDSNALLQAVSNNTTDAIFVRDRNGRTIFANPAMLRVLGKDTDAVIGHTNAEIYANAGDAKQVDANELKVIQNGRAEVIEETVNCKDGIRTFYSTKAPWLDRQGRVKGLVGISTDITDRKRIENALRAHETHLEILVAARTAEVTELLGHLESTREEEKRAIARELHDDLGSAFTALSMHLTMLFQKIPSTPEITDRTEHIKGLMLTVVNATRRIQTGLRPDKLDIFGLKAAISEQVLEFEKYTNISCQTSLPDEEIDSSPQHDIVLFRIVQEALNNIAKYAKATQVRVILDDREDSMALAIIDNGIGINAAPSSRTTHGLRGMQERAAYLGGKVKIITGNGKGTTISVSLPKSPPPDANVVNDEVTNAVVC
jgi:PAS domain S-box-containing protein